VDRQKLVIWGVVGLATVTIVWRVGFHLGNGDLVAPAAERDDGFSTNAQRPSPGPAAPVLPPAPEHEMDALYASTEFDTPSEPDEGNDPEAVYELLDPELLEDEPTVVRSEPNGPELEAINLKDVEMKWIVEKIATWTGKVVIPTDDVMKLKVTIYAPRRLPRSEALEQIYGALRLKGYVAEHTERTIFLRPIADARVGVVPAIGPDEPLALLENKEQIVQKLFHLGNYSPAQMAQIVQPLIGEYGHVSADETTGHLLVIDTVASLMRVETIVEQFDTAEADQIQTEIFEVHHRDPGEIVQVLQMLLRDGATSEGRATSQALKAAWVDRFARGSNSRSKTRGRRDTVTGKATALVVGGGHRPVLLVPEPKFKWIIAKAAPEDLETVGRWIEKLDRSVPTITAADSLERFENKNQLVQRFLRLEHCSPSRMAQILAPLMGSTAHITAEDNVGTLLLIDTVENLIRAETIIAQFDVPEPEETLTRVFELHHRDPQEVAALVEAILADGGNAGPRSEARDMGRWSSRHTRAANSARSRSRSGPSAASGSGGTPMLFVPEPHRNWLIVKAAPEDLEQIATWIQRLDTSVPTITVEHPLARVENKNQVVQKFVKLKHYPPGRMIDIVGPLLGESGYVTAEESTGTLLLIDTVENLLRVDEIIAHFDIPETEHTATEIFEVRHRDPTDVVASLESILTAADETDGHSLRQSGRTTRSSRSRSGGYSRNSYRGYGAAGASMSVVGASGRPVVLIPETAQGWIIAKASPEDVNEIGEWIERLDRAVPTILADTPLSTIENRHQIVQRCIKLANYSPSQMGEIVLPLLGESGYVSADESTGNLLVIDTVENLIRIEAIVAEFDVPEAEQMTTRIFEMLHADPSEVTQLLRLLLSDGDGRGGLRYRSGNRYGPSSRGRSSGSRLYRGGYAGSAATSTVVGPSEQPVVLVPEPRRKWIIARASAEDMKLIEEWIGKLDSPEPVEREHETVPITYVDVREVASRLNEALQQMPGTELRASVLVQPLEQARQVMIFGRPDLREMVKKLIEEIDVPPGQFETKHFTLKYADPELVKSNIDDLFGDSAMPGGRFMAYRYGGMRAGGGVSSDTVKTIAHVTLKQITVIASPENVKKIGDQIAQWDVPIDVNEVKPRILELHNSDPVQMTTLLSTLFSEERRGQYSFYDYLFGSGGGDRQRIVGPLYGQVTFEEVPGTKKIIVISNVPGAYGVVEELIQELDSQEAAEVPRVVRLNYADPETLCERLNAMFNEPGTSASIRLSERGLSEYSMDQGTSSNNHSNNNNRNSANRATSQPEPREYRPWWTMGRRDVDEMEISNIIGRVRFIPDTHSKSVLVLAPPEYMRNVEQMIQELDVPGKQVMIKAVIVQVDHQNMTSLGVQVSSDPTKWETLDNENAIVAWNALSQLERHGALVFGAGGDSGSRTELTVNADVGVLIDFLVRQMNAKILNQQTLWTKDNEEAQFFKGQRVGFQTRVSISDTGGRATSDFDYEKVGMTLRARPSITPERNVDMIINVILSQLTSEVINNQRVRTELDTTTNMIVEDGQTLMLGGMLFQEDTKIQRKIPLFGDLPLVGGLFRHNEATDANSELLIFVTPYVIDTTDEMRPEAREQLDEAMEKLDAVRGQLLPTQLESESQSLETAESATTGGSPRVVAAP
jgi:type II secretory pathway component GspD/PulD (secretin)